MKRNIDRFVMTIGLLLLALMSFLFLLATASACKPQKMLSDSKINQEIKTNNDVYSAEDRLMQERIDRLMRRLVYEELIIDQHTTKYNTDAPVDTITGRHPVSEQTDLKISRNTTVNETDSTHKQSAAASSVKTADKSNMSVKTKSELKEENHSILDDLEDVATAFSILLIIGLVIYIIVKTKKS